VLAAIPAADRNGAHNVAARATVAPAGQLGSQDHTGPVDSLRGHLSRGAGPAGVPDKAAAAGFRLQLARCDCSCG